MSQRRRGGAFVGREAELSAVLGAVDGARDGVPAILLVGGDAGIGKSTLVAQAASRAGVPALLGRCVPVGGDAAPLAPLADLLRQVRRVAPEAAAGVDVGLPSAEVFTAMLELIDSLVAEQPAILGFEDLHWADPLTWDLFEFLARNLVDERVVLAGTFRANEVAAEPRQRRRLAELSRLPGVCRVDLAGLRREDVARQMAAILEGTPAAALVDEVVARGQGNPFFTEELVAAHVAGEDIPALLSDLLATELAALDGTARDVLAVIATVGRQTGHDLLAAVAGVPDHVLEAALRAALDAQLIVVDGDAYRFRHALIGEVVQADLLPPQRRRLHRRIADALRSDAGLALTPGAGGGELAFHLDRAGDAAAAFAAYLAAADEAAAVTPAAALGYLERALELWPDGDRIDEDRVARLWEAAELAYMTGNEPRAVELAQLALAGGEPPKGWAAAHERVARYLWAVGDLAASAGEYERAAALLASDEGSVPAARVYAGLAEAEMLFCRFDSSERWCLRALEAVPTAAVEPRVWLHASRVLGVVRSHQGRGDEGVDLCRGALRVAEAADDRAFATIYLAESLLQAGRFAEAVPLALDGAAEGQLCGLDRSMGGYLSVMAAEGLIRLGRWSEGETVLGRLAGVVAVPPTALRWSLARVALAARRGDLAAARSALEEAWGLPVDPWHRLYLLAGSAEFHLLAGEWAAAASAAEEGWSSGAPEDRRWPARFAMLLASAEVERALDGLARREAVDVAGTVARLRALLEEASIGPVGDDAAAHLAHAGALVARLTGPDPEAWSAAADAWEGLDDRWSAAVARMHEADAAAATGAPARAADALRAAYATAVELGAAPLQAQVEAVSRRTRIGLEAPEAMELDGADAVRLGLTPREAEVLSLVAGGKTNRQIGEFLYVSEKTASVHVSNILRKLGVTSRVEAAAVAQRIGIA